MSSMKVSNLSKEMLNRMFAEGKRFDGRGLLDLRDFEVEYGVSNKAEGSARIRMGKTEVIVGVKMQLGVPYPDSPDKGNLMVSADLLPLASPRFESGPPRFPAIELPRLMDRMIRESGMIDLKKLCIEEGEKVWTVIIDIYPINDDGSLIDAASIAVIAALYDTVFPGIKEDKIDYSSRTKDKLPLLKNIFPISFTFYKLGNSLILNPTREEEEACDSKITWGISMWNGEHMLHSCQKGQEIPFNKEEILKIMEIIPEKYDETIKKVMKFIK
ncbi:MAG: exosome complex protein Rrp42 [Candidatus Pacearchaeota archaeon]|nr:exosome complex protein Rrp42 [Candidatus Pacearchaeota archaeon]